MHEKQISRRNFVTASASVIAGGALAGNSAVAAQAAPPTRTWSIPVADTSVPVTHLLADWAARTRAEDVPEPARKEAIRSVLNWVGVAVGGCREPAVDVAVAALLPYAGAGKCLLWGRSERFDPLRASLLAGISSHVLDFDDADLTNLIHPAASVASALFALAQDRPISGAEFLLAFIVGVEVEDRLGNAIYPSHYDMGWHITGTCGVFGAAAACGKVLGLSSQQMTWALGLAATQASGLKIMFGTMAKSFHPGHAAEGGMLSALLAAKNFTASEQAIEGKEGYVYAAAPHHDYKAITSGLGTEYSILNNGYKPFPCGIVLHPILDAMVQLYQESHPNPADVKSIVIQGNPLVLQLTGKKAPTSELEAKFSVYHAAAVSLLRGRAGVKEFSTEAALDPAVIRLRELVSVETSPDIPSDSATIIVTLKDGRVLKKHVEHAIGTLRNPMSDGQLEAKFRDLTEDHLPPAKRDQLLNELHDLPNLKDVSVICRTSAAPAARTHKAPVSSQGAPSAG